MTAPNLSGGGHDSASAPICPWCSAPLKTGKEETCPSCGAALHEVAEAEVPGVTRVDHEAILKARVPAPRGRGLLGWLSGEYEPEAGAEPQGSIAPPDDAVRREMLRLELAALEAEAEARQAEVAAELAEARVVDAEFAADAEAADETASATADSATASGEGGETPAATMLDPGTAAD